MATIKRSYALQFRNYTQVSPISFLNDIFYFDCIHNTDWCSSLLKPKWNEIKKVFIKLSNAHAPIQCRILKNKSQHWFDADNMLVRVLVPFTLIHLSNTLYC